MSLYVMWAELVHSYFLYVLAVLNLVPLKTAWPKNVLKWNRELGFEFSIQSSVYGATTGTYSLPGQVYCKLLLNVNVEIDPFSCEQTTTI